MRETPVGSAARTATGSSTILGRRYDRYTQIYAQLDVTVVDGTTPTLDVIIEDTFDGTNFNTIGTFTQKTDVGREVIEIYPRETPATGFSALFADRLRVSWTIAGETPAFTFSVIWIAK